MVCSSRWRLELAKATNMLGAVLLVPAAGFASDHVGRRPVIVGSALVSLVSGVGASTAQTLFLFLLWRFLVAAATCSAQVLIFIMIYEVTGRHSRPVYGVLDTAIGTTLVPPLMYAVSELEPHWYLSHAFLLVPTVMLIPWAYELEESPIWLLTLRGTRAARSVVFAAAKSNGILPSQAEISFGALRSQISQIEGSTLYSMANVDFTESYIKQRAFRWRALSVFVSWFSVNLAYYGLVLRATFTRKVWHAGHMVAQSLLYAFVCWYLNNHGQRGTLSILLGLLSVSAVAHASLPLVNGGSLSVPLGIVVSSLASGALSVNYGYTAEVFPTLRRSVGLTVSYAFGRVGVLTASGTLELVSTAGQADAVLDLLVAVLALLSAVAIQWLPEVHALKTHRTSHTVMTEAQRKAAILDSLGVDRHPRSRLSHKSRASVHSPPDGSAVRSAASKSGHPASSRRPSELCERRKSLGAQSES
ncbi:solute carrier family 22 member 16-like [Haemaphysalis longicornis]